MLIIIITASHIYVEPSNLPKRKFTSSHEVLRLSEIKSHLHRTFEKEECIPKEQTELLFLGNARGHNQVVTRNEEQAFFLPCLPVASLYLNESKTKNYFFLIIRVIIVGNLEILKKY